MKCEYGVGFDSAKRKLKLCGAETSEQVQGVPICDEHIQYSTKPPKEWV